MPFEDFFQKPDLPQFDIVTFFEVIEHLDNPLDFIQNVKKVLKPDGRIVLSTPSRERMLVNLYEWDFPPYHLSRWNETAISRLFEKIDFEISLLNYADEYEHFLELFSMFSRKFSLGLTGKIVKKSKNYDNATTSKRDGDEHAIIKRILTKFIHLGLKLKHFTLVTIPAIVLWDIGKIGKIKNGVMVVELTRKRNRNIK